MDFNRIFPVGTEIEVSSDDDGFRGSWYEATVVGPPQTTKPKSKRTKTNLTQTSLTELEIQYKTLFEDEKGTAPLRETLNMLNVRPKPPEDRVRDRNFRVSDEVDGYYNDGWWEGVVTEVIKGGKGEEDKYKLYFRGTKEEILFEKDKCRVHRNWTDGYWKSPVSSAAATAGVGTGQDDENTSSKATAKTRKAVPKDRFGKGTLVEVSSDEVGFEGAWFAGTVVKSLTKNKFLIEYQNLRTDDDSEFLKEEVDNLHMRPVPPEIVKVDRYTLLEEVDAFYNDAWWVGVISKVLSDSKYIVFFRYSNEEMQFPHSEIRPHQDWIDGKWVVSSKALKL